MWIGVGVFYLGSIFGSFILAQVWRLRAGQFSANLIEDGASKTELDKLRIVNDGKRDGLDRSVCLSCGVKLAWYDLFPLLSWLINKGKCRNCKKFIGYSEILIEIILGLMFLASYMFWPYYLGDAYSWLTFVFWLAICVVMIGLIVYDYRWMILPDLLNWTFNILALIYAISLYLSGVLAVVDLIAGLILLVGLYLTLYLISKGKWIGFGDVKLSLGLALLLHDWRMVVLMIFLANFSALIYILPTYIAGKINRKSHLPYGPFLLFSTFIVVLFGSKLLQVYMGALYL